MSELPEIPGTDSDDPEAQPPTTVDVLFIERRPDEDKPRTIARYAVKPEVSAGLTIQHAKHSKLFPLEITPLADELAQQTKAVNSGDLSHGEAMLTAQAATLDALFHKLARFGLQCMQEGYGDAAECYLRLGFKAQAQCRNNWEALNEIKNPRAVFVHGQANIGKAFQVNNNARGGEMLIPPNELNGVAHEMDGRGEAPAIGVDPGMAAVGAIDGATIARGQGQGCAERIQGKRSRPAAPSGQAATGLKSVVRRAKSAP